MIRADNILILKTKLFLKEESKTDLHRQQINIWAPFFSVMTPSQMVKY